jgi:glutaredoxin-like protein
MGKISEKDRKQLKDIFKSLSQGVKVVMFTQEIECEHCKLTRGLLEEVSELSEKISLEVHDFVKDADLAKTYNIDKIPATVILGDFDYGIRFYGMPAGYEFTTYIQDIINVSQRDHKLSQEVLTVLSKVNKSVHIQVMVYPTCPYCAQTVLTAHRFAMANENITADMVELTEFPHLTVKYNVQGVPKIIINEKFSIVGAIPEKDFADALLRAIKE